MADEAGRAGGLLDSLRNLARTLLAIVQTRIELAANEIEEQSAHLTRIVMLGLIVGFCLALAVVLVVFFLVVLFWDSNRLAAIGALAALFFAAGALAYALLRAALAGRPKLFSASLGELAKDREELGQ